MAVKIIADLFAVVEEDIEWVVDGSIKMNAVKPKENYPRYIVFDVNGDQFVMREDDLHRAISALGSYGNADI